MQCFTILLFWKLLTGKIRRYIYLSIKPIYLRFGILNSVFQHWIGISHSLIPFFRDKLVGEGRGRGNVPVYSCERLGLYIILLGWLWSIRWFKSMFYFLWFYAKVKKVHKYICKCNKNLLIRNISTIFSFFEVQFTNFNFAIFCFINFCLHLRAADLFKDICPSATTGHERVKIIRHI